MVLPHIHIINILVCVHKQVITLVFYIYKQFSDLYQDLRIWQIAEDGVVETPALDLESSSLPLA